MKGSAVHYDQITDVQKCDYAGLNYYGPYLSTQLEFIEMGELMPETWQKYS